MKITKVVVKMAQNRPPNQRPAKGAPGVKMLITAGALAVTMFGWVMLTTKERLAAVTPPAVVVTVSAPPPALALDLPPIPTLVPPPAQSALVIANPQPQSQSQSSVSVAQSAPPLRSVSAPVMVTRSSR